MTDHFVRLFEYNDWANRRLAAALDNAHLSDSRALTILSHLIVAQQLWLDRIRDIKREYQLWEPIPIPKLTSISASSTSDWFAFLASVPTNGYARQIDYVNIKGIAYQNSLEDIITHVINHGTHHRAQVSQLIRLSGGEPPVIDLISFARNEV
jgi:uncharacterized damage-inducible protein DinB